MLRVIHSHYKLRVQMVVGDDGHELVEDEHGEEVVDVDSDEDVRDQYQYFKSGKHQEPHLELQNCVVCLEVTA